MIFAPYKNKPIRFAEIGIATGASVHLWANYFNHAERALYFFDRDQNFLVHSRNFGYPTTDFALMDIRSGENITDTLSQTGGNLDVILDDSSHDVSHQKTLLESAFPFLKSGGIFIIEDVFRNVSQADYLEVMDGIKDQVAFYAFIETEHANKYSPGWDNDKILYIVKA
jgi:predicted O-methyltransferase YrrM